MINLYDLQAKYRKNIFVTHEILNIIENEGSYWLELALQDFLEGMEHEKRFDIMNVKDKNNCEKIIIRLREKKNDNSRAIGKD